MTPPPVKTILSEVIVNFVTGDCGFTPATGNNTQLQIHVAPPEPSNHIPLLMVSGPFWFIDVVGAFSAYDKSVSNVKSPYWA